MEIVALLVALVALAVGALALRRADVVERRARRWAPGQQEAATQGAERPAPAGTPPAGVSPAEMAALRKRVDELSEATTEAASAAASAGAAGGFSRVSVVRYDAFEDLGGRLSFSAAVLDDRGKGFVLTAIHGRSETRSYLKQVPPPDDGTQRELSPEESMAITQAMKGRRS